MITIDFETRSRVDLRKCGTSVYARHPSTEILCLAYCLPGQKTKLWTRNQPAPEDLLSWVSGGATFEAHNVFFERNIWHHICHKQRGWPDIQFHQWRCSMAAACRLTLPRALGEVAKALDVPVKKDEIGAKIMQRLCKPKKPSQRDPSEWDNDPAKFERLYSYCVNDVDAEIAVSSAIGELTHAELKVWQLDQRINLRGVLVDRPSIQDALAVVELVQDQCKAELQTITEGQVETPKQVAALRQWILGQCGEDIPDLREATVEQWLTRDDLPSQVRRALELRAAASSSSVGKLKAMNDRADGDDRVRGTVVYHGAATGRWAGSGIQVQNFPRGSLKEYEIEAVHKVLPLRDPEAIDLLVGDPIAAIVSSLRSMIVAAPNHRLLVCDFAQIECRVLAWLAGQDNVLAQFRADEDVYVAMASEIYGSDEISKPQRQVGKTAVLGLGYGMGHRKFRDACLMQAKVEIDFKLARQVVKTYRTINDKIAAMWGSLGTACIRAIETRQPHQVGRLVITCNGDWLRIKLPSGRELHYHKPELVNIIAPWSQGYYGDLIALESIGETLESWGVDLGQRVGDRWTGCNVPKGLQARLVKARVGCELEAKEPKTIKQIQFMGVDSKTKKWSKQRTYGGKLVENVTQAVARDFLAEAMLRVDAKGYPITMTVHDEVVAEVPNGFGSLDEFNAIMKQVPRWGSGCPIGVSGFETLRYKKD